ncbi:MAG: aminoglycoside phosphotransferase family protein [Chloroflexi bacterium]|nr:aminoglycoside phosphotransferase family protein [Chloroflexota bacterium]MDA1003621.1 aminoglycoside phosphotransferase family protein [Chloroflexota bacterium]
MTSPPEADAIAGALLDVVRARAGRADLVFAEAPERLPGGEDAASYTFSLSAAPAPFEGPLVLRLFPERADALAAAARRARFEAAVHEAVASASYPCPGVRVIGDAEAIAGSHFLVLARLPGDSLWASMRPPSRHAFGAGSLLAEAQARLHELDPALLLAAVAALGDADRLRPESVLDWSDADLSARGGASLLSTWQWLRAHHPAPGPSAICHANFHPRNVIVDGARFVGAVNWTGVQLADPHFDVAQTIVWLHFAPLDAPAPLAHAVDAMRRALQVQYRRAYARTRPLDEQRLAYYEAFAIARRLLEAAARARGGSATGWAHPDVRRRLAARLGGLTGITTDTADDVVWA